MTRFYLRFVLQNTRWCPSLSWLCVGPLPWRLRWHHLMIIFVYCLAFPRILSAEPGVMGPLPKEIRAVTGMARESTDGLFIGVDAIVSKTKSGAVSKAMPYATDDAVDLAYLFAIELELIEPNRVTIALSSQPSKPSSRNKLQDIIRRGARLTDARMETISQHLAAYKGYTLPDGALIAAVFAPVTGAQSAALVCQDSQADKPATYLSLSLLKSSIAESKYPRSFLLLDTLRRSEDATTPLINLPRSSLNTSLSSNTVAVLLPIDVIKGLDIDARQKNGSTTIDILNALKDATSTDARGVMTVAELAADVETRQRKRAGLAPASALKDEVAAGSPAEMSTSTAWQMPLAVNSTRWEEYRRLDARRASLLVMLRQSVDGKVITKSMAREIETALSGSDSKFSAEILVRLADLESRGREGRASLASWWSSTRPQPRVSNTPLLAAGFGAVAVLVIFHTAYVRSNNANQAAVVAPLSGNAMGKLLPLTHTETGCMPTLAVGLTPHRVSEPLLQPHPERAMGVRGFSQPGRNPNSSTHPPTLLFSIGIQW